MHPSGRVEPRFFSGKHKRENVMLLMHWVKNWNFISVLFEFYGYVWKESGGVATLVLYTSFQILIQKLVHAAICFLSFFLRSTYSFLQLFRWNFLAIKISGIFFSRVYERANFTVHLHIQTHGCVYTHKLK